MTRPSVIIKPFNEIEIWLKYRTKSLFLQPVLSAIILNFENILRILDLDSYCRVRDPRENWRKKIKFIYDNGLSTRPIYIYKVEVLPKILARLQDLFTILKCVW